VARDPGTGQELAQEAFFRVYERWDRLESAEHARRFAFRVAINLAKSHLRKHVRVRLSGLEPRDGEVALASDAWADLADALGALSGRQRASVVLVDYVGLDAAESGEVLGISPATVRAHLMRGRRALRAALEMPEGDER
jgi:RNA polymerase sigma factor (sigma-70 family)